jgi:hypothetical protein
MRMTPDLISLIRSGAGLDLDVKGRFTEDLIQIAAQAKQSQVRVTFRGLTGRVNDDLLRIADAGRGYVTFADVVEK